MAANAPIAMEVPMRCENCGGYSSRADSYCRRCGAELRNLRLPVKRSPAQPTVWSQAAPVLARGVALVALGVAAELALNTLPPPPIPLPPPPYPPRPATNPPGSVKNLHAAHRIGGTPAGSPAPLDTYSSATGRARRSPDLRRSHGRARACIARGGGAAHQRGVRS